MNALGLDTASVVALGALALGAALSYGIAAGPSYPLRWLSRQLQNRKDRRRVNAVKRNALGRGFR